MTFMRNLLVVRNNLHLSYISLDHICSIYIWNKMVKKNTCSARPVGWNLKIYQASKPLKHFVSVLVDGGHNRILKAR